MAVDGWKDCKFGEIASAYTGFAFKSDDFIDSGVPVIRMSNLKEGKIDLSEAKHVSEQILEKLDRFRLQIDDFLFGMSGSLSNYAVVRSIDIPCYLNQRVGKLVAKENADYAFIKQLYLSNIIQQKIELVAAGAAQKNISASQIEEFQISIPSLPEQKKIAEILESVDDTISKIEGVIAQTQRVKQGLIQQLLMHGIGHTKFKPTSLGGIPESWEIRSLYEICFDGAGLQTGPFGSQLHAHEYVESGIPVIMPKDLVNGVVSSSSAAKITQEKAKVLSKHMLKAGDIIFSRRGDVGRCALISIDDGQVICGTGCLRARLNPQIMHSGFLIKYLHLPMVQDWIKENAVGQTMPNLNTEILGNIPVCIPPIEEQIKIFIAIQTVDANIGSENASLIHYKNLKTGLMSDLLTGLVRVNLDAKSSNKIKEVA